MEGGHSNHTLREAGPGIGCLVLWTPSSTEAVTVTESPLFILLFLKIEIMEQIWGPNEKSFCKSSFGMYCLRSKDYVAISSYSV
jgi:hypothetical protein